MRKTYWFMKKWAVISFVLMSMTVYGASVVSYGQTAGEFSVRAVIPDNQIDKKQTYFDLRMKPGGQQTLEVVVMNSSPKELTVDLSLNAACTGRNGLVVYTEPDVRDETMKVSITDIAALPSQTVTVAAHGEATAKIDIKMPDEPLDGVILGGIAVTAKEEDAPMDQGVSLKNTITYVVALKITQNDNEIKPDFGLAAITPGLINYRTAVVVTLRNHAARLTKNMKINAQVFPQGSDTALHALTLDSAEMAPQSKGDFVIDWQNRPLAQGTYRLAMTVHYEDDTWQWDEEFQIGGEADDLNNGAVALTKDFTWLYALAAAAALALVWFVAYQAGKRGKMSSGGARSS